jgi:hypothetical protein
MEEICAADAGNDFINMGLPGSETITEEKEHHGGLTGRGG